MEPYGRFYELTLFILGRNWIIINLNDKSTRVIPISSSLALNSDRGSSLSISWMPVGVDLNLKESKEKDSLFFTGEIHQFNISDEGRTLVISSFDLPMKTVCWQEFLSLSASHLSITQSMEFKSTLSSFHYNKVTSSIDEKKCLLYLHGGPFQRHTNEFNPILSFALEKNYDILIPHYPGDPIVGNLPNNILPGSSKHIALLNQFISTIKNSYEKMVCVGHSFGCYLGYQLLIKNVIDNLVTINGVMDVTTLKELSPVTFSKIEAGERRTRERQFSWHHFHSSKDPVVPVESLYLSFNRIDKRPESINFFDSDEHEIMSADSLFKIVQKLE